MEFRTRYNVTNVPTVERSNRTHSENGKEMFKKPSKVVTVLIQYLVLLEYRNTPFDGMLGKSPAQLLQSRQLKIQSTRNGRNA